MVFTRGWKVEADLYVKGVSETVLGGSGDVGWRDEAAWGEESDCWGPQNKGWGENVSELTSDADGNSTVELATEGVVFVGGHDEWLKGNECCFQWVVEIASLDEWDAAAVLIGVSSRCWGIVVIVACEFEVMFDFSVTILVVQAVEISETKAVLFLKEFFEQTFGTIVSEAIDGTWEAFIVDVERSLWSKDGTFFEVREALDKTSLPGCNTSVRRSRVKSVGIFDGLL